MDCRFRNAFIQPGNGSIAVTVPARNKLEAVQTGS